MGQTDVVLASPRPSSGADDPGPITARVTLFGPLTMTVAGRDLPLRGAIRRALVTLLALDPGEVVPADRLIAELWPEGPPDDPARSVRVHVSQLRAALDGLVPGSRFLLEGRYPRYRFTEAVTSDVAEARALQGQAFDRLARDPIGARGELRRALAMLADEPLADLSPRPFVAVAAERLAGFRQQIELSLADLGEPVATELVTSPAATVPPELAAHRPPHPVGRRRALDTIVEAYRATSSDPWPQVVEVVGVGGVGKTALLAMAAERLATVGAPVRYASWLPTPFATLEPLWRAGLLPRTEAGLPASRSLSHLELAEQMLGELETISAPGKVPVVILDDLHWLPQGLESTMEVLVTKHRGGALFLLAHRPEPRGGHLARLVSPSGHRIVLDPFTPDEMAELLEASGAAPGEPAVAAPTAPWVAAALLGPERPGRFDRLTEELSGHDPATRRLVERLAFHPEGLTLALLHHEVPGAAGSTLQRIRGLIADGLVVEIDTTPVRFALVHELVGRRVLEAMSPIERLEVQAALHRALTAAGASATARVHHALGAWELLGEPAGETIVEAARHLVGVGVHADAVALAEEVRRRRVVLTAGQRCLVAAVEAYGRVGTGEESADAADRLLDLAYEAAEADDWDAAVAAVEYRQLLGRNGMSDDRELALLRRGQDAVGDEAPRLRFALLASSLFDAMYGGREAAEVVGTPDLMLAIADDLRDPLLRAMAIATQHWLLSTTAAPLDRIRDRSEALLRLAATTGDATVWSRAHGASIGTALDLHDLVAVRHHVDALAANADPLGRWQATLARCGLLIDDGELARAERAIAAAGEEAARRGVQHRGEALTAQRFLIGWAEGGLAGWQPLLEAIDWAQPTNLIYGMALAAARLHAGDADAAAALGREVAQRCLDVSGWYSAAIGSILAEVAAFAGDVVLAGLCLRLLAGRGGRRIFVGAATLDLGPADHYVALALQVDGAVDRAAELRVQAAAAAGCVLWQARLDRATDRLPRLAAPAPTPWSWIA